MDYSAEFDAFLGHDDVTLSERDVALLREIDHVGSINKAADKLGRSYSRAQQRIVDLENAFGPLVDRNRGGVDGGGSQLTERARSLLSRYDQLHVEFNGVAETKATTVTGPVVDRDGELADVATAVGTVRALVPPDCERARVQIRADAVTLQSPSSSPPADATSARNRLEGTVTDLELGDAIARVTVDVGSDVELTALATLSSVEKLSLAPGEQVLASFKATATRGVPVE